MGWVVMSNIFGRCCWLVAGHFNPGIFNLGIFNPKLQPRTFQFQIRGWNIRVWRVHGWKVWGWRVQGWKVHGWKIRGWKVHGWKVWGWKVWGWSLGLKSPGLKCPSTDWIREFIFSCFLAPEFDFRHVGCTKKPKYLLCFFISFIFESSTWFLLGHRSQEGTIQCIFYIFFLISVHKDTFC